MKRETLKAKVDKLGRKRVADKCGISYAMLTQKLCGFAPLHDSDVEKIKGAIDRIRENG